MNGDSPQALDDAIKRILGNDLGISDEVIAKCDPDTPLLGRGIGLDSVEAMALVLSLEREFNIQIPDTDLTIELFQSIRTLSNYAATKLAAKQGIIS
jgi:acyl carrier protein